MHTRTCTRVLFERLLMSAAADQRVPLPPCPPRGVPQVASKLRIAEAEFEKEQLRGRASRLKKQLERLGGDSLEVATRSTRMEVDLAQALQRVGSLQKENEALHSDVAEMIELKLRLAEVTAQARAAGAASDQS